MGYIADKQARPWFLPIGSMLVGIGSYMISVSGQFLWLMLSVFVTAVGSAMFHPDASQSVFFISKEKKGFSQSVFQAGGYIGLALAPVSLFLLNILGIKGIGWFLVISSLLVLFLISFARVTNIKELKVKPRGNGQSLSLLHSFIHYLSSGFGLLILITTIRSLCFTGLIIFLPPFLMMKFHLTTQTIWIYNFSFLLGSVVGSLFGGDLGDKMGRTFILRLSFFLSIPFILSLPWLGGVWLMIFLFFLGVTLLLGNSASVIMAQEHLPGREGLASTLVVGFTAGISGILLQGFGAFADHFGVMNVLWIIFLLPVVAFLFSLSLGMKKMEIREKELEI